MSILRNLYDRAVTGLDTIKRRFMPFSLIEGVDGVDPDPSTVDSSGEPDYNAILSNIASTVRTATIGTGSIIIIIAFIFAIVVANDAIVLPWFARIFLFFYVFTNMPINPILLIGIPAYYAIRVAYNIYNKNQLTPEQRKIDTAPYLGEFYGFLPFLTWKTDSNWTFESLLFLFKIKSIRKLPGKSEPALVPPAKLEEVKYTNMVRKYRRYLEELVPGFSVIAKQEFGITLIKAYETYMTGLNYSSIPLKPVLATTTPTNPMVPPTPSAATTTIPTQSAPPPVSKSPDANVSQSAGIKLPDLRRPNGREIIESPKEPK